jgi:heat shock protein HslJ
MRMRRLLLLFPVLLATAACGSNADNVQSGPPPAAASAPTGRTYVSTGIAGHTLVDGTQVLITFGKDGELSVQAGCNTLGTSYKIDDGKLLAENFGGTEMGCDAPRQEQDQWLAAFLSSKPSVAVQSDELVLATPDVTLTMRDRERAQPGKPLAGTTWIADTLLEGDAASSVPADPKVWLKIADGKVQGSDGCNGFGGNATIDPATITFSGVASTLIGCVDRSPANPAIHELVKGKVSYELDGDRLTLTTAGGKGLGFRAESATP